MGCAERERGNHEGGGAGFIRALRYGIEGSAKGGRGGEGDATVNIFCYGKGGRWWEGVGSAWRGTRKGARNARHVAQCAPYCSVMPVALNYLVHGHVRVNFATVLYCRCTQGYSTECGHRDIRRRVARTSDPYSASRTSPNGRSSPPLATAPFHQGQSPHFPAI